MSGAIFHGGGLDAAIALHGGRREDWLDLSTGINPNPWPIPAVSADSWARLPDAGAMAALLDAARTAYCVPEGAGIVAANGTQALIEILPRALGAKSVAIVSPTYGEHAHVWRKAGASVRETGSLADARIGESLVVVNPNNPDANLYRPEELLEAAERLETWGGWLVVDEAFMDCFPKESIIPGLSRNVIVLRSFGKFFGLAGVRLGFVVAEQEKILDFAALVGPWAVSGPALELGSAALRDGDWIAETRKNLLKESKCLSDLLQGHGLTLSGVNPLFVQVRHPEAESIRLGLATRHILVRHFPERTGFLRFGLPGNGDAMDRLDAALGQICRGMSADG